MMRHARPTNQLSNPISRPPPFAQLDSPFAGGETVVGQAKPHTLNMQQLFGVGIGCPAASWKTSFKVALAKHSAETCVVGAVVSSVRRLLHNAEAGTRPPSDVLVILFVPNLQPKNDETVVEGNADRSGVCGRAEGAATHSGCRSRKG